MRRPPINRVVQSGFSLVSAIFLLVVLAGLGAVAARLNVMQQQTVSFALRSAQAFHAAGTGVAWAAHRAVNTGWCATETLDLTEAGAAGFRVEVSCVASVRAEGADTVRVYIIDALAHAGTYGGPEYVSRHLQVKVTDRA